MTPALMNYIGGVLEMLSLLVTVFTFLIWVVTVCIGVLTALEDNASIRKKLRRYFVLLVALATLSTLTAVLIPGKKTFNDLYETYWKADVNTPSSN